MFDRADKSACIFVHPFYPASQSRQPSPERGVYRSVQPGQEGHEEGMKLHSPDHFLSQ